MNLSDIVEHEKTCVRSPIIFGCPLDCDWTVNMEGMMTGVAARHLQIKHRVTSEYMMRKPKGFYRFTRSDKIS